MKALTCEMCGSTNLIKKDGVFVCQSCGTQYSVEEAKKMMVEGTVDVKGTIKVDTSDELKNLYEIARRAKDSDNNENAAKYYDMILVKDPQSWEANFYVVYFKAMACKIAEIWSAANSLSNCVKPVLELVRDNVASGEEQKKVIEELKLRFLLASTLLAKASKNHFDGIDIQIKEKYRSEFIDRASAAAHILYLFGDTLETVFPTTFGKDAAYSWKKAIEINNNILLPEILDDNIADRNIEKMKGYVEKIKKYDSNYEAPEFKKFEIPAWGYVVIVLIVVCIVIGCLM